MKLKVSGSLHGYVSLDTLEEPVQALRKEIADLLGRLIPLLIILIYTYI